MLALAKLYDLTRILSPTWLSSSSRWEKEGWGASVRIPLQIPLLKSWLPPNPPPHHQPISSWSSFIDFPFERILCHTQTALPFLWRMKCELYNWLIANIFFHCSAICTSLIASYPPLNFTGHRFAIQILKSWPRQCLRRQLNQVLMRSSVGFMWGVRSQLEFSRKIRPRF